MKPLVIIILDDDAFLIKALQRTIQRIWPNAEIKAATEIEDFWQLLHTIPDIDLVLSDYLMPKINGLDVLERCLVENPYPVRALLTGDMTLATMMRQPNVVHAYLGKPFNETDLTGLLKNVAELKKLPFAYTLRKQLGAMVSFPVYPLLLKKLQHLVKSDEFDLHDIAKVVTKEPVITAKLLQLANSAYLGFHRRTSSIDEAISRLGTTILMSISTSLVVAQNFQLSIPNHIHEKQLAIAANYAGCVKHFAKHAEFKLHVQELLFSVALLSFVGKMILLADPLQKSDENDAAAAQLLIEPNLISAYVMTLWGYDTTTCTLLMTCHDIHGSNDEKLKALNHILYIVGQVLFYGLHPEKLALYCEENQVSEALCLAIRTFDWHAHDANASL